MYNILTTTFTWLVESKTRVYAAYGSTRRRTINSTYSKRNKSTITNTRRKSLWTAERNRRRWYDIYTIQITKKRGRNIYSETGQDNSGTVLREWDDRYRYQDWQIYQSHNSRHIWGDGCTTRHCRETTNRFVTALYPHRLTGFNRTICWAGVQDIELTKCQEQRNQPTTGCQIRFDNT